jgi:F-type H+-transporting ATPase subunit epsilon
MAKLKLEIVTTERLIYSGEVDMVLAPGVNGQLGILPHHASLLAALEGGDLIARTGEEELWFAVAGGFMEVTSDQVTVLADAAERAEEIDLTRAEQARKRAEALLRRRVDTLEFVRAEAALRRSLARIKAARHRRRGARRPAGPSIHSQGETS